MTPVPQLSELLRPGKLFMLTTSGGGSVLTKALGRRWLPNLSVERIRLFSRKRLADVAWGARSSLSYPLYTA